jgi:hypothetical protein
MAFDMVIFTNSNALRDGRGFTAKVMESHIEVYRQIMDSINKSIEENMRYFIDENGRLIVFVPYIDHMTCVNGIFKTELKYPEYPIILTNGKDCI